MGAGGKTVEEILGLVSSLDYVQTKTARIFLPPQHLVEEYNPLVARFDAIKRTDSPAMDSPAPELAAQIAQMEDDFEDHFVSFKMRALSHKAWADLFAAHPPTKEQRREDSRAQFNPETFPAVAIATCLIDPEMSVPQVQILEFGVDGVGGLNDSQFNELFNTCVAVNVGGLAAPKSVAGGAHRLLSAASAPQPTDTGHLEAFSLDG